PERTAPSEPFDGSGCWGPSGADARTRRPRPRDLVGGAYLSPADNARPRHRGAASRSDCDRHDRWVRRSVTARGRLGPTTIVLTVEELKSHVEVCVAYVSAELL